MRKNIIHIFCDLCLKEIEVGNRPGTHFNKNGWNNIVNNFKKETNSYYDRHQLKNKWDQLKKEWKQWKQLLKNKTGIGWDPWRRTVYAADEWWRDKLKVYLEAAKFKLQGIEPDLEEKLDRMFLNTVAMGDDAWAPSSGVIPNNPVDTLKDKTISEVVGVDDSDEEPYMPTTLDDTLGDAEFHNNEPTRESTILRRSKRVVDASASNVSRKKANKGSGSC